jgi:GTP cyclohydrolase II
MGFHNTEETIFAQPLDVSTYKAALQAETSALAKSPSLPITNVTSTKSSSTNSIKKKFTNGLTSNNLKHSLRSSDAIKTPPITPPTTFLKNSKNSVKVECQVRARIPTSTGEFFLHLYRNNRDDKEHLAVVYGDDIRSSSLDAPRPGENEMDRIIRGAYKGRLKPGQIKSEDINNDDSNISSTPPYVRIHSECFTGETVHSARCDCGEQLDKAMRLIQLEGRGVVIYLRQEGRGIGLADKLR